MTPSQQVALNTGILYMRMAVTVVLSLYTTRLTLAELGVQDFGIFNLVAGAVAMLTFLNASMASATQRFMSFAAGAGDKNKQKKIFSVSLVLHLGISLLVLGVLEVAYLFLFGGVLNIAGGRIDAAKFAYQCAVVTTVITIAAVPYDAVVNARENMLLLAVLGVVEAVLKLLAVLFLGALSGDKLMWYVSLIASISIVILIFRALYCHWFYPECSNAIRSGFDRYLFDEMSSFAGWSFLGASTSMLSNYGQGIVLNMFFGPAVNAAQAIATQVSGQLGAFSTTMLRALQPMITKSEGAGRRDKMLNASIMGGKLSFFMLMLFYVPIISEMHYVFGVWLKEVPEYAVLFCQLQLLRNLVEQLFLTLSTSISAVGKIRMFQVVTSLLAPVPLLIAYGVFSLDGPPEVIYISFVGYAIVHSFIVAHFAKVNCGLDIGLFFSNVLVRCSGAFSIALIVGLLPQIFMPVGIARLATVCLVSLPVFAAVCWWIGFDAIEREVVSAFVRQSASVVRKRCERRTTK